MAQELVSILERTRYTPREMYHLLQEQGYIGQDRAKKALCLMAYRHMNRIRKLSSMA
ncbi:MAG: hypothetical protein AAFU64_19880 [Bacteroidota bacterium]